MQCGRAIQAQVQRVDLLDLLNQSDFRVAEDCHAERSESFDGDGRLDESPGGGGVLLDAVHEPVRDG